MTCLKDSFLTIRSVSRFCAKEMLLLCWMGGGGEGLLLLERWVGEELLLLVLWVGGDGVELLSLACWFLGGEGVRPGAVFHLFEECWCFLGGEGVRPGAGFLLLEGWSCFGVSIGEGLLLLLVCALVGVRKGEGGGEAMVLVCWFLGGEGVRAGGATFLLEWCCFGVRRGEGLLFVLAGDVVGVRIVVCLGGVQGTMLVVLAGGGVPCWSCEGG